MSTSLFSPRRLPATAYRAAGSEPKRVEWYDSGHGLPRQAYLDMVDWLEEQIGIDAAALDGPVMRCGVWTCGRVDVVRG